MIRLEKPLQLIRYSPWFCIAIVSMLSACATTPPAEVVKNTNPDTGLSSWKVEHPGFSFELAQVVPDFIRAVYASRGLPKAQVNKVAAFCVFGTILRNNSDGPLSWKVSDWHVVTADGQKKKLKPKSQWIKDWQAAGVLFKWTMLADEQTYAVGDWGQGFTTYPLQHGEVFDLVYTWSEKGRKHHGVIKGARCAEDI